MPQREKKMILIIYLIKNDNDTKATIFDILFKKNNEKDFSEIDSEINKILGKESGLNYNNNFNNKYNKMKNNYSNNNYSYIVKYNSQKIKPNITNIKGINLGEKPYERQSLKPIINGGRRGGGGGGLMAIGYKPNKNSIFNDMNFGGLGLRKNKLDNNSRFGNKKELQPIIMKEKKNDNIFGFNNREKLGGFKNLNNNKRNNPIMNQFNNEINGDFRRRKNFYSSPNSLGWNF